MFDSTSRSRSRRARRPCRWRRRRSLATRSGLLPLRVLPRPSLSRSRPRNHPSIDHRPRPLRPCRPRRSRLKSPRRRPSRTQPSIILTLTAPAAVALRPHDPKHGRRAVSHKRIVQEVGTRPPSAREEAHRGLRRAHRCAHDRRGCRFRSVASHTGPGCRRNIAGDAAGNTPRTEPWARTEGRRKRNRDRISHVVAAATRPDHRRRRPGIGFRRRSPARHTRTRPVFGGTFVTSDPVRLGLPRPRPRRRRDRAARPHQGSVGAATGLSAPGLRTARSGHHRNCAAKPPCFEHPVDWRPVMARKPRSQLVANTAVATNGGASADSGASKPGLVADIIIANAPDPLFVSDLAGKILQANDAASQLLGFRQDEVLEQSLSRFISPEETREFVGPRRGG